MTALEQGIWAFCCVMAGGCGLGVFWGVICMCAYGDSNKIGSDRKAKLSAYMTVGFVVLMAFFIAVATGLR